MESIVFQVATGFDRQIRVINGKEGSKIGSLQEYNENNQNYGLWDYFLDNVTGEMYNFNGEKEEWVAKVNSGLHNRRSIQEFNSIGRFVIKVPVYKPKESIDQTKFDLIYKNKITEDVVFIKKLYANYYLFQGI